MMHVQRMRRPFTKETKIPQVKMLTPFYEIVNKLLQMDISQEEVKQEIIESLTSNTISASECFQMFLSTAWKDRNRIPIITQTFLQITQETDVDFGSLIDSCHNNLLKVLTVIGQPSSSDLSFVTLMANIHKMEDLDEEHRTGVEMYLVEIAKAFWPYFMPEKSRNIWNDEICDAICDVLVAVGNVLERKCPINMEKAFNNITIRMFTPSTTEYTLLRFMELKEIRASNWSLTTSAKSYYTSAYSRHSRSSSSSSSSPISQPSLDDDDDDDDVFNSTFTSNIAATQAIPEQSHHKVDNIHCSSSDDDDDTSTTTSTTSTSSKEGSNYQACDNNSSTIALSTELNNKENALDDPNYKVTITKDTASNQCSGPLVVRVLQLDSNSNEAENIDDSDDSLEWTESYYCEANSNVQSNLNISHQSNTNSWATDATKGHCQNNTSMVPTQSEHIINRNENNACGGFGQTTSHQGGRRYSENENVNGFTGLSRPSGFPGNNSNDSHYQPRHGFQRTFSENDSNSSTNGGFSRPSGFPGNNSNDSHYQPRHGFQRTFSENDSNSSSSGGFSRPSGFPGNTSHYNTRHGFQRALSETDCDSMKGFTRPQEFPGNDGSSGDNQHKPRHGFQRMWSDNDGTGRVNGCRSQSRPYWRSNLEFPVEEINQEYNEKSRLYLLSFALKPASLERPSDLTLTAELEEQKPWLKDIILAEPLTVVERYG